MSKLIVKELNTKPRVIQLQGESFKVGRQSTNAIALRDTSLSRQHCEIRQDGDGFLIADLGSRNGTLVNGVQIKEHTLEVGDKIEIGNCMLIFERELPDRDYTLKPKEKDTEGSAEASQLGSDDGTVLNAGGRARESKLETRQNIGKKESGGVPVATAGRARAPELSVWVRTGSPMLGIGVGAGVLLAAVGAWFAFAGGHKDPQAGDSGPRNLLGDAGAFDVPGGAAWKARDGAKGAVARREQGGRSGGCLELEVASGEPLLEAVGPSVAVTAGRTYRVAFDARAEGTETIAGVRLQWLAGEAMVGGGERSLMAPGSGNWAHAERVVLAPDGADHVRLSVVAVGDAGRVQVDDLGVEETKLGAESPREESAGSVTVWWGGDGRWTLRAGNTTLLANAGVSWSSGDVVIDQTLARDVRGANGDKGASWKLAHPFSQRWEPFAVELRLEEGSAQMAFRLPARTARGLDALTLDLPIPGEVSGFSLRQSGGEKKKSGEFEEDAVEALLVNRGGDPFALVFTAPVAVRVERAGPDTLVHLGFPGKRLDELKEFALSVVTGPAAAQALDRGPSLASGEAAEKRGEIGRALQIYRGIAANPKAGSEMQTAADRVSTIESRAAAELEENRRRMQEAEELESDELCRAVERACGRIAAEYEGTDFAAQAARLKEENVTVAKSIAERRRSEEANRLLTQARGYAGDGQPEIARALFTSVVSRFPDTDWARDARTELQGLEKK